jgi:uncharacterized protein
VTAELTIAVIAKEPVPGAVKTRLTPPCTATDAAELAKAMLTDTLAVVARAPASRRLLALDGRAGDWLPAGFDVVQQVSGTLDVRLAHVLAAIDGPALLIGMDTPQITPDLLCCDFDAYPAWLGPAADGGYWAIGLAEPDPGLVRGVPMSVPHTFAAQRQALAGAGLRVGTLPALRDVDTWADATAVARQVPAGRFARAMAAIRSRAASDGRSRAP